VKVLFGNTGSFAVTNPPTPGITPLEYRAGANGLEIMHALNQAPSRRSQRQADCRLKFAELRTSFLTATAALLLVANPCLAQLPAFPGAEGFGWFATGGRGGEIYRVTTLDDSGPGTFRDAVSKPNRTVVFDVGGVIRIKSRIVISHHLTIAGQTAPGDGITIYGNGLSFSDANHTITRHLRVRMGMNGDSGKDAITIASGHDMIFDHVSVSWGRDENFSISGPVTNVTIQNSIIAEGLQPHSCGGLIQTDGGVSILRTLYLNNHTRNPKVKGVNQFVNNVIVNWGGGGGYILGDSAGASYANVIGNYFLNGPSTSVSAFSRGNLNFRLYAADNFQDMNRNGVLDGALIPKAAYTTVSWQEKGFDYPSVENLSAQAAFRHVASQAGASQHRDATDERFIKQLLSFGRLGETVTKEPETPSSPTLAKQAADSDQDGLPDYWETALGLDPNNSGDAKQLTNTGYTQLEEYLNWLAAPHVVAVINTPIEVDLTRLARGFSMPSYSLGDSINGTTSLNGSAASFTPSKDFVGLGALRFNASEAGSVCPFSVGVLVRKLD
jgi:pectate lyase